MRLFDHDRQTTPHAGATGTPDWLGASLASASADCRGATGTSQLSASFAADFKLILEVASCSEKLSRKRSHGAASSDSGRDNWPQTNQSAELHHLAKQQMLRQQIQCLTLLSASTVAAQWTNCCSSRSTLSSSPMSKPQPRLSPPSVEPRNAWPAWLLSRGPPLATISLFNWQMLACSLDLGRNS